MAFTDPLREHEDFDAGDLEWLHLLVGDWQLVSDLGFGDLLLCFPDELIPASESPTSLPLPAVGTSFRVLAHARPSTGLTSYPTHLVGLAVEGEPSKNLRQAWVDQRVVWMRNVSDYAQFPQDVALVPLVRNGKTLAVITLTVDRRSGSAPSYMEQVYQQTAQELLLMANQGTWPDFAFRTDSRRGAPRVGDGTLLLDPRGNVVFCSPNGLSAFRRLGHVGNLVGENLLRVTRSLDVGADGVDETMVPILNGTMPWRGELRVNNTSVTFRAIPLRQSGTRSGALVLCRDVTELRRRDLQLVSKDATIREIHHRVKNNLQTVSALLRLQTRRSSSEEAKHGLQQAMRRVSAIARVHESLSHEISEDVDFDELMRHQVKLAVETATQSQSVRTEVTGEFGRLPSSCATPMALIINEIVSNAVQHGLEDRDGTVSVTAHHLADEVNEAGEPRRVIEVTVSDDGRGMGDVVIEESGVQAYRPAEAGEGLGMQIVRTLVASELDGSIRWQPREGGGTSVVITARLAR